MNVVQVDTVSGIEVKGEICGALIVTSILLYSSG